MYNNGIRMTRKELLTIKLLPLILLIIAAVSYFSFKSDKITNVEIQINRPSTP
jgi:hypothetical protein